MSDINNNGLPLNKQYYIPSEILSLILSNVDVTTLYKYCTLVCKRWNAIIKESVWKLKCEQEFMKGNEHKDKLQLLRQKQYPYNVYQTISVFKNSFYTNLIKNPCGEHALKYWKINKDFANLITIEDCTNFHNNILKVNDEMISQNITKCFSTLNLPLHKIQIIDLYKQGLTQQFIDEYQPPIYVSEWYGTRRDSTKCAYQLWIRLFDANYTEIKRCNCVFHFARFFQEGEGIFHKVQHVFKNYGKNVRFVYFYHCGIGNSPRREIDNYGFSARSNFRQYGTKYTNANVQLFYPNDTHLDHLIRPYENHELCGASCAYLYPAFLAPISL